MRSVRIWKSTPRTKLAGRGGERRRGLWNVAASSGQRDPDCDSSAHLRAPEPLNGRLGFRISSHSTAQLPNRSARTSSLGHLHRPMPKRECQGKFSARRVAGSSGHRIGLRMGHQRSRLRAIPGTELARDGLTSQTARVGIKRRALSRSIPAISLSVNPCAPKPPFTSAPSR